MPTQLRSLLPPMESPTTPEEERLPSTTLSSGALSWMRLMSSSRTRLEETKKEEVHYMKKLLNLQIIKISSLPSHNGFYSQLPLTTRRIWLKRWWGISPSWLLHPRLSWQLRRLWKNYPMWNNITWDVPKKERSISSKKYLLLVKKHKLSFLLTLLSSLRLSWES